VHFISLRVREAQKKASHEKKRIRRQESKALPTAGKQNKTKGFFLEKNKKRN
jgi:hypothetical protein